jgi:hypothetical protein
MRARSEARSVAAFAVSETLAGTFRKLRFAIRAIAWSFVMFTLLTKASIVCWMVRLSVLAVVRRQTTLTPAGLTWTVALGFYLDISPKAFGAKQVRSLG